MTDTTDREIVTSRIIDAPREQVFKAFTDPEHIAEWWGPNGFTNTIHEMDVRVDGVWRFMMHGPDGTDYPNKIVYREIVAPERLVFWHGTDEPSDEHAFLSTVTFEEEGDKTKLTMTALFSTVDECERNKEFGAVEGGMQTLGRLNDYLIKA